MASAFLIAAPASGQGKTTLARALMGLLRSKGYAVQPFKCGPDYIDTKFHEAVCGRPSINLDTFMATPDHVRAVFNRYGADADVCVVEGMMGLFDGFSRDRGSSADIAATLGLPVVLVVDAQHAAYSTAALLSGFISFRSDVRFAGVLFNKVGSARHERMLREVCADLGVRCLGCVPRRAEFEVGSRYLGLDFAKSNPLPSSPRGGVRIADGRVGDKAVETSLLEGGGLEQYVDWRALVESNPLPTSPRGGDCLLPTGRTGGGCLVARNAESFSFLYQETLDRLGDVTFFDPETDVPDLDTARLLYLPGGYPEQHAAALARNEACRQAISRYARRGGRVMAECGGMMYLCRAILTDDGEYPMCGVLPYTITARKADRRLSLGYRRFTLDGREYRGHEFHYTQFAGSVPPSAVQVYDARGEAVPTPVFRQQNVLASYTHLYPCEDFTL